MEQKQFFEREPRPPVEQLAVFLDKQIEHAREIHMMTHQSRMESGSEHRGDFPQYYERSNRDGYQDISYERIMLKAPARVSTYRTEFLSRPNQEEPWRGATFHVVRPYMIAEGYEDDTNEYMMPELPPELLNDVYIDADTDEDLEEYDDYVDEEHARMRMYRTESYVLYMEMPEDKADSCYLVHRIDDDFVIEPFDLELIGSIDKDIDEAVESLLDEIASEIDDNTEPQEPSEQESEDLVAIEDAELRRVEMNVFAEHLLKHLRDNTSVTPFRQAA